MKQTIFLLTILSLALADKPDPIYKSPVGAQTKSVQPQEKTDKIQSRQDQYGAPAADTYGSPAAPAQDNYGSPAAPVVDTYGSPAAEPVKQDSYGAPKGEPVAAPQAQGSVGTQGYYYYYYPVASSSNTGGSYGSGGQQHATKAGSGGSSGGLLSGGLLIPLVLGLGLLLLLAVGGAALVSGRSFNGQSIFASMAPFADELTVSVLDAIKVYADLNQVTEER
jgi:hypothetical protein